MNRTEFDLAASWAEKAHRAQRLRYAVLGAGNGGLAMAGHLALQGFEVRLYNRSAQRLQALEWHGGIELDGQIEGFASVECATSDLERAVRGADVVMVVVPATAHRSLAAELADVVEDGQLIVLNPGRTGGALEVRAVLDERGSAARTIVAETQTLVYAARSQGHRATIFRVKDSVPLATLPSYWTPKALDLLRPALDRFVAGNNVLTTSLDNVGAVFHPALTVLNAGWIESSGGDFEYYLDGITPALARVLEDVDRERVAVASSLGVQSHSARQWLYNAYGSVGSTLYEAIQNTPAYKGIRAPASIDHRYLDEDVPTSLVPMSSLGNSMGVSTPTIDTVIDLASRMTGSDYRSKGRTVESLGLSGKGVKEISQYVVGSRSSAQRSSVWKS